MKPTPPPLKWLAEKRARILSKLIRAQGVFDERTAQCQRVAAAAGATVDQLAQDLAGLDRTISVYDSSLDPTEISPVNGWKGRYGQKGGLSDRILEVVTQSAPEWVRTDAIETFVTAELWLTFETPAERRRWRRNSLQSRLKALVQDGRLERLEGSELGSTEHRHWRLRACAAPSLSELQSRTVAELE